MKLRHRVYSLPRSHIWQMANKDSRSGGGVRSHCPILFIIRKYACHTTWSNNKISVIKEHFGISNKGLLKRICLSKSEREERKGWWEEKKKNAAFSAGLLWFPPLGAQWPSTCRNDENWHSAWLLCICYKPQSEWSKNNVRQEKNLLMEAGPVAWFWVTVVCIFLIL